MSELFHAAIQYIVQVVGDLGYLGIFLLMMIESSFIPFPSEVVLIPAGYLVGQGQMSATGVVLAGVAGSLVGAYINYCLALFLGRKFILEYGRYFLLPQDKFLKLEEGFLRHGRFATFFGRLIFGVRQWISIPAGLVKMPLLSFSILTSAGAGIWVIILVVLGYFLGEGETAVHTAKLIGYWLLGAVAIVTAAYIHWQKPKKASPDAPTSVPEAVEPTQ